MKKEVKYMIKEQQDSVLRLCELAKEQGIKEVFEKLESRGNGHLLKQIQSCNACSKMYFRIKSEMIKK